MGKFTVEKWQCDRCGCVGDKRPYIMGHTYYSVVADVDHGTAGGRLIEWREMCGPCNIEVGKALDAMMQATKAAKTPT